MDNGNEILRVAVALICKSLRPKTTCLEAQLALADAIACYYPA